MLCSQQPSMKEISDRSFVHSLDVISHLHRLTSFKPMKPTCMEQRTWFVVLMDATSGQLTKHRKMVHYRTSAKKKAATIAAKQAQKEKEDSIDIENAVDAA
jgi:hypothetical protein